MFAINKFALRSKLMSLLDFQITNVDVLKTSVKRTLQFNCQIILMPTYHGNHK